VLQKFSGITATFSNFALTPAAGLFCEAKKLQKFQNEVNLFRLTSNVGIKIISSEGSNLFVLNKRD